MGIFEEGPLINLEIDRKRIRQSGNGVVAEGVDQFDQDVDVTISLSPASLLAVYLMTDVVGWVEFDDWLHFLGCGAQLELLAFLNLALVSNLHG